MERLDGDHIAEDRRQVVGALEPATGTQVGVGQLAHLHRARVDQRRRPHGHPAV